MLESSLNLSLPVWHINIPFLKLISWWLICQTGRQIHQSKIRSTKKRFNKSIGVIRPIMPWDGREGQIQREHALCTECIRSAEDVAVSCGEHMSHSCTVKRLFIKVNYSPCVRTSSEGQSDGDSTSLFLKFFFYFFLILLFHKSAWWYGWALGNSRVGLRSDEMKRHEWKHHAKACRSARGWSLLSPTPWNVVQPLQLARCLCVEVVNQWKPGRQSHWSIKIWWGTLMCHLARVYGWKKPATTSQR